MIGIADKLNLTGKEMAEACSIGSAKDFCFRYPSPTKEQVLYETCDRIRAVWDGP
jgi:hypothetical protein